MFKSNLLVTLMLFSFLLSANLTASNSEAKLISECQIQMNNPYIFVRVIECKGGDTGNKSMILIDRGDNEIQTIELETFNKKYFESNFKIITKTLNDIKSEGYKLISSSGGGGDDNGMIMQNYIFEKI